MCLTLPNAPALHLHYRTYFRCTLQDSVQEECNHNSSENEFDWSCIIRTIDIGIRLPSYHDVQDIPSPSKQNNSLCVNSNSFIISVAPNESVNHRTRPGHPIFTQIYRYIMRSPFTLVPLRTVLQGKLLCTDSTTFTGILVV
jgi:hypothetical protein